MTQLLCPIDWIVPTWVNWVICIVGVLLLIIGMLQLFISKSSNDATFRFEVFEFTGKFYPIMFVFTGLFIFFVGIAFFVVDAKDSMQRYLAKNYLSSIITLPVSWNVTLNNESLQELQKKVAESSKVSVSVGKEVKQISVSGAYKGECGVELLYNVCKRTESISCKFDGGKRQLVLCKAGSGGECP